MLELINDVLDLPDTVATQYKIRDGEIHIYVESVHDKCPCRVCGKTTRSHGYGIEQKIRALQELMWFSQMATIPLFERH